MPTLADLDARIRQLDQEIKGLDAKRAEVEALRQHREAVAAVEKLMGGGASSGGKRGAKKGGAKKAASKTTGRKRAPRGSKVVTPWKPSLRGPMPKDPEKAAQVRAFREQHAKSKA